MHALRERLTMEIDDGRVPRLDAAFAEVYNTLQLGMHGVLR